MQIKAAKVFYHPCLFEAPTAAQSHFDKVAVFELGRIFQKIGHIIFFLGRFEVKLIAFFFHHAIDNFIGYGRVAQTHNRFGNITIFFLFQPRQKLIAHAQSRFQAPVFRNVDGHVCRIVPFIGHNGGIIAIIADAGNFQHRFRRQIKLIFVCFFIHIYLSLRLRACGPKV